MDALTKNPVVMTTRRKPASLLGYASTIYPGYTLCLDNGGISGLRYWHGLHWQAFAFSLQL
jgi:hypothetical protein